MRRPIISPPSGNSGIPRCIAGRSARRRCRWNLIRLTDRSALRLATSPNLCLFQERCLCHLIEKERSAKRRNCSAKGSSIWPSRNTARSSRISPPTGILPTRWEICISAPVSSTRPLRNTTTSPPIWRTKGSFRRPSPSTRKSSRSSPTKSGRCGISATSPRARGCSSRRARISARWPSAGARAATREARPRCAFVSAISTAPTSKPGWLAPRAGRAGRSEGGGRSAQAVRRRPSGKRQRRRRAADAHRGGADRSRGHVAAPDAGAGLHRARRFRCRVPVRDERRGAAAACDAAVRPGA